MATLQKILSNLPNKNQAITPDIGFWKGAGSATMLGAQEGVLPTTFGVLDKVFAKARASSDGLKPLTTEQFTTEFGEDEDFKYKPGETLYEAQVRRDYAVNTKRSEFMSSQAGFATQFGFGMLGNMVADGPLSLLPATRLVSAAKGLKKATLAGDAVYTASKLEKAIAQGKGVWKVGASELTKQQMKIQGMESAYVLLASRYADRQYGVVDAVADTVFGTALGNVLSVPALRRASRLSKHIRQLHTDKVSMSQALETGDVRGIAEVLERNSPLFQEAATGNREIMDILSMTTQELGLEANLPKRTQLKEFITEHEDALWFEQIKGLVPQNPDLPIVESVIQMEQTRANIVDAVTTGKLENLTQMELDIVLQADANVADTVADLEGKTEPLDITTPEPVAPKARPNMGQAKTSVEEVPIGPKQPDLNAQSKKLDEDLRANQEQAVRDAEARRVEKRKTVEKSAKAYAQNPAEGYTRNMDRIGSLTTEWLPWLSYRGKSYGDETQKLKDYLITLIDDTETDFTTSSVAQLIKLIAPDKLDYKPVVLLDLLKTKESYAKARSVGSTFFRKPSEKTLRNTDPSNIGEEFAREIRRLSILIETTSMTPAEAGQRFEELVNFKESGKLLGQLHNESVQRRHDLQLEGKTEKQKLKYLKSFLDGLNRVGVNLQGSSVQNAINAQITLSQAPLFQVLTKHKMVDAFDTTDTLISDLMYAKRTGETPDHWKGEQEAIFTEILEVYKTTNDALVAELNKFGANIMYRADHTGVSHRWDGSTMAAVGYDAWRKDMLDNVDWEAVETNMGGVLVGKRNEFGFAQEFVDFDKEAYLKSMWDDLTGPRSEADHPSMDIAASFGKHRNIVIKPESEITMMKKYSGKENMGLLYLDQIRYRAEMVAVARELGNNPIPNYRQVVSDAGLNLGVNTTRKATKFGGKLHDLDMTTLDWTLSQLTGKLDNPADLDISRYAKTARQASHILYLWTSGVSAITDIPLTISTLQNLGATNSTASLVSAFSRSFKRRLLKEGDQTRRFYTSMGANFDAMMNAGSRHMGLPDGKTAGSLISKASEAMFSINGLNAWTGVMQEAFFDVLSRDLADGIKAGKLDPSMMMALDAAGIKEADLLASKEAITNVNGVDRFDVHKLGNDELIRNTMAFFSKYRDEAIMMPDVSTSAMIRGGQRAGTLKGEAMRTLLQYQAFPLAMNRVTARKFLVNAEGGRPWTTEQVTFSRMIGFFGGMLAMAYVATVIKDLLRGREPMHMGNMTANSWIRIVNQSGVGGMLQSVMEVGSGNPKALLAPLPSDALKIAGSDNLGEAIYRSRNIWSGGNNPAAPVIQKAVAAVFPDMVGIHFKMLNAYHEQNTGQSPLFWAPSP